MRMNSLAFTVATGVVGCISFATAEANAFCCPRVAVVQLVAAGHGTSPRVSGFAEVNECEGMSFLHVVVRTNAPDGSQFITTMPAAQPLIGDWFTVSKGRAETVWQGVTTFGVQNGGLSGRTIAIMDSNFVTLASGKF